MLTVQHLSAGYQSNKNIVQDVSFSIQPGELVGVIGPNGAGKSTTIKAVMGLLPETKGNINWASGFKRFSYIPESPIFYENLTLWEHLRFAASVAEIEETAFQKEAEKLLELFNMTHRKNDYIEQFSKGMQQKSVIMCGFIQNPDLYIIDEPFIGLDPRATKILMNLINERRKAGAAVLMSTHVLDTAERWCDRFVMINGGRVVAQGSLADIQQLYGNDQASLFECFNGLTEDAIHES
ncbi:MAG: ABC transporter ATP-binding protein [Tuberibacillus sp.]